MGFSLEVENHTFTCDRMSHSLAWKLKTTFLLARLVSRTGRTRTSYMIMSKVKGVAK